MTDERLDIVKVTPHIAKRRALRAIALFEAIKGIAALAAMWGVIDLMHRDVRHLAIELIGRFGLNPNDRYPSVLLHYADLLPNTNVRLLLSIASGYILLRFIEAYGLWNDRIWGEWFATLSGMVYIPFEIHHLIHRPSIINASVLAGNFLVVVFLVLQLWRKYKN